MSKNKNKQTETMVEKERNEEVVTVLNEANDDQVINIDTSALDKELKEAEGGAGLVMPIRGGYSDKSNKKDKKDDKKNAKQAEKSSGVKSIFSMFLKGEAEVEEVSCKSVDDIKEILEAEDLITLGKFMKKHPEILQSYFKASAKRADDSDKVLDVEIGLENKLEYIDDNEFVKLERVELDKKKRKALRRTLSKFMNVLDDRLSVKELFDFVEKELGVNVIKIVNSFLDELDSYDADDFNKFMKETVDKIQGSALVEFIEYLTGQDIITTVNFLFQNDEHAYDDIKEMSKAVIDEIYSDDEMQEVLSIKSDDGDDEMFLEFIKTFIKVAKKHMKNSKAKEALKSVPLLLELKPETKKEVKPGPLAISFNKLFGFNDEPQVNDNKLINRKPEPREITPDDLMAKVRAIMAM